MTFKQKSEGFGNQHANVDYSVGLHVDKVIFKMGLKDVLCSLVAKFIVTRGIFVLWDCVSDQALDHQSK